MKQVDEASLSAWHSETHRRQDSRLIANRYFQGYITAVQGGGPFLVSIQRVGENVSDGNAYSCAVPGYVPQVGDLVELVWRDAATAHVDHPLQTTTATQTAAAKVDDQAGNIVGQNFLDIPANGVFPLGYSTIRIYWQAATDAAVNADSLNLQFNGDRGPATYDYWYFVQWTASSALSGQPAILVGNPAGSTGRYPGAFGWGVIEILNYTSTYARKNVMARASRNDPGGTGVGLLGGDWNNETEAISTLHLYSSGNFLTGSRFTTEVVP